MLVRTLTIGGCPRVLLDAKSSIRPVSDDLNRACPISGKRNLGKDRVVNSKVKNYGLNDSHKAK